MSVPEPIVEQPQDTGEVSAAGSVSTAETAVEPEHSFEDASKAVSAGGHISEAKREDDAVCTSRQRQPGDACALGGQVDWPEKNGGPEGGLELPGEDGFHERVKEAGPSAGMQSGPASTLAAGSRPIHEDATDTDGSEGHHSGSSFTNYDFGPTRSTLTTIPELSMWDAAEATHHAPTPANSAASVAKASNVPSVDQAIQEAIQYHDQLLAEASTAILDLQRRQTTLHQSLRTLQRAFDSFESLEERWIAVHAELLRDKEHSKRSHSGSLRSDGAEAEEHASQVDGFIPPAPSPVSEPDGPEYEPPLDPIDEAFGEGAGIVFWPIFILATIGVWVILNEILTTLRTFRLPSRRGQEIELLLHSVDTCRADLLESIRAIHHRLQLLDRRIAAEPSEASLALAHERDTPLGPGFFIAVVVVVLAIRHLMR